jgi:putative ABC transport system substrate-binding protein
LKRREFITLFAGGAAAAWPLTASAQQPTIPVIGFVHLTSPELTRENIVFFHRGLGETGFVEHRNVVIEYRWAHGKNDQLPTLVAELVRRRVAVIVVLESTNGALAAKAATQTIPIVFLQAADSVRIGLVDSLNRPGGNATGINLMWAEMAGKRLELLLQLVPEAKSVAYLRNPTNPVFAEREAKELEAAARTHAVRLPFVDASRPGEFEAAFLEIVKQKADALVVSSAVSLLTDPDQIVALAGRYAVPAVYAWRPSMAAGGLLSYATNLHDAWRQAGIYTGRILKGESPADLPVFQPTKVELVVNLKTAKALGLKVPLSLQVAADEVIE